MSRIHIKMMSDLALEYLKRNINTITNKIILNENNGWIYEEFPKPLFIEKKYDIDDFSIMENHNTYNKDIDFQNSIKLYEVLSELPRYILIDERFWLWLHFDKFYSIVRDMMEINGPSTIQNMWMHKQGVRRGLMFGVLSRCYFRVDLTVDSNLEDKYELTRWVVENPLRFRELTWRTYSSESHLVRGVIKGEKKAINEIGKEDNSIYATIAKFISRLGSVQLLDIINEKDIEELVYCKTKELMSRFM